MRMREDVKTLTGPDKAALLLMAVGEENASRLFSMMEDEEIRVGRSEDMKAVSDEISYQENLGS